MSGFQRRLVFLETDNLKTDNLFLRIYKCVQWSLKRNLKKTLELLESDCLHFFSFTVACCSHKKLPAGWTCCSAVRQMPKIYMIAGSNNWICAEGKIIASPLKGENKKKEESEAPKQCYLPIWWFYLVPILDSATANKARGCVLAWNWKLRLTREWFQFQHKSISKCCNSILQAFCFFLNAGQTVIWMETDIKIR